MPPIDATAIEKMQCMEIWGGNQAVSKNFQTPGLSIFVDSQPFLDNAEGGGDIYYLTSCASGRISRFLLADVSGHGESAADLAVKLRDLMRANVNRISQERFAKRVNEEFGQLAANAGFATAAIATFFQPTGKLAINLAGHPNPVYYVSKDKTWHLVSDKSASKTLANLPFGIQDDVDYPQFRIPTSAGDMFLIYTDAFVESLDAGGKQLGMNGLVEMLNKQALSPDEVIPYLKSELKGLADENLKEDDATAILGFFTESKTTWLDNLMAPFRLFGSVADKTRVRF